MVSIVISRSQYQQRFGTSGMGGTSLAALSCVLLGLESHWGVRRESNTQGPGPQPGASTHSATHPTTAVGRVPAPAMPGRPLGPITSVDPSTDNLHHQHQTPATR